jgi:hypothetical protein
LETNFGSSSFVGDEGEQLVHEVIRVIAVLFEPLHFFLHALFDFQYGRGFVLTLLRKEQMNYEFTSDIS